MMRPRPYARGPETPLLDRLDPESRPWQDSYDAAADAAAADAAAVPAWVERALRRELPYQVADAIEAHQAVTVSNIKRR